MNFAENVDLQERSFKMPKSNILRRKKGRKEKQRFGLYQKINMKGDIWKAAIIIRKWDQNLTREPDEGKEEALVELKDGNPVGEVKVIRKKA